MSSSKKLTWKGTLRQVFIRVYRLEIQPVMVVWYFRPSFVNYCPSNLLSGSPPPPPPPFPVSKYNMEGGDVGCWVVLETLFYMSLTLCIWLASEPTKLLDHPKQKPKRGGGLKQINTCDKVPVQVNFVRWRHFALLSISLIFLCL